TTEPLDGRTCGTDQRVVELDLLLPRREIGAQQQVHRLAPPLPAVGDLVDLYLRLRLEDGQLPGPERVEADPDPEHGLLHEAHERQSRIPYPEVLRREERAVLQGGRAFLPNELRPHHPQAPARWRPLHLEQTVVGILGSALGLGVVPRCAIPSAVVFEDGVDTLDHTTAALKPLLLGAVLLDSRILRDP